VGCGTAVSAVEVYYELTAIPDRFEGCWYVHFI
jgi:hypothetical protein